MERQLTLQLLEVESVRCVQREKTECKCGPCFETTCSQMSLINGGFSHLDFLPQIFLNTFVLRECKFSNVLLTTFFTI